MPPAPAAPPSRVLPLRRSSRLALTPLLWLALGTGCVPGWLDVGRVWERFEVTLPIAVDAANPFDPEQVEVHVELRRPGRPEALRVPAFVYRPFARELRDGRELLTPDGELEWRARFTPPERGLWIWRWVRSTPAGREEGAWRVLLAARARPGAHGFVRRSPHDDRYLAHEDGSPFFAVGVNLGWHGAGGTADYERWLDRYAAEGVNVIRVWMPRWTIGLFYPPADLRDWRASMDRAWQLDRIFELAEARGIQVMLVLLNHGAFSRDFNSGWDLNPFNAALGGPLADPLDVWTDPEGRRIVRHLFRYVAARWGHATNLLCWELWNEANLTAPAGITGVPLPLPMDDVVAWHREMAGVLRDADPNDHLVSTSSSDGVEGIFGTVMPPASHTLRPVWELPEIDFAQLHLYPAVPVPFFPLFRGTVAGRRPLAGGPVLIGEADVDSRGPVESLAVDPEGEGFHDVLWSGLFAEALGTAMPWWWDNLIEPLDRYFHFGPLARITRGVAFDREGFASRDLPVDADREVLAHVLAGRRTWLLWITNQEHVYFAPDRTPIAGARLTIPDLPAGTWRATWIDPWAAAEPVRETIDAPVGGPVTVDVPTFSRDTALRLDRLGGD